MVKLSESILPSVPISRKEAQASGLRYYLTDKPCLNGHIAPRTVRTRACRVCNLDHARSSYAKAKVEPERYKPRAKKYDVSVTGCYLEHYPDPVIKYIEKLNAEIEAFDAAGSWLRASRNVTMGE